MRSYLFVLMKKGKKPKVMVGVKRGGVNGLTPWNKEMNSCLKKADGNLKLFDLLTATTFSPFSFFPFSSFLTIDPFRR